MKNKRLFFFISLFSLIFIFLVSTLVFFILIFSPIDSRAKEKVYVDIAPNSSVRSIAKTLKSKDIIRSEFLFEIYAKLGPARSRLKPGFYEFSKQKSIVNIINDLFLGNTSVKKITFPEGYTISQIAQRFSQNNLGDKQDFEKATKDNYNYGFLKSRPKDAGLEGYLFPDTYIVRSNITAKELIGEMLKNFDQKITPLNEKIATNSNNFNLFEIVTLASIIEDEAKTPTDRRLIAGILINRLRNGMRLEVDVTINYITGRKQTSPEDLKIDSPYNTYKAYGLPPTPINNPGLDSIEAVISPTSSDYLFFLADKSGNIHYAKTLIEHNQNIARYLN